MHLITNENKKLIGLVENFNRVFPNHLNGVKIKDIDFNNVENWYKNYIIGLLAPMIEIEYSAFQITLPELLQNLLDINLYVILNVDERIRAKAIENLQLESNSLTLLNKEIELIELTEDQLQFVNFVNNYSVSNMFYNQPIVDILGDSIGRIVKNTQNG